MNKKTEDTDKKNDDAKIPLIKNKVPRVLLRTKVNEWVAKIFNKIYNRPQDNDNDYDFQRK